MRALWKHSTSKRKRVALSQSLIPWLLSTFSDADVARIRDYFWTQFFVANSDSETGVDSPWWGLVIWMETGKLCDTLWFLGRKIVWKNWERRESTLRIRWKVHMRSGSIGTINFRPLELQRFSRFGKLFKMSCEWLAKMYSTKILKDIYPLPNVVAFIWRCICKSTPFLRYICKMFHFPKIARNKLKWNFTALPGHWTIAWCRSKDRTRVFHAAVHYQVSFRASEFEQNLTFFSTSVGRKGQKIPILRRTLECEFTQFSLIHSKLINFVSTGRVS